MDPSEIISRRVNSEKKRRADGKTRRRSQTSITAAASKVLDTDDLLIEILLRLGFPTTLVRAALVCRRWLHHASDTTFLRRFRELHPPRHLGFYINSYLFSRPTPRFVPFLPQPAELATVVNRVSSSLDTYKSNGVSSHILYDFQNGNVFVKSHKDRGGCTFRVHNLIFPERGTTIIPLFPFDGGLMYTCQQVLSKEEEGGRMSYFYVMMHYTERKNVARVYKLQDGVWCMYNLTIEQIPYSWHEIKSVLVDNKVYIPAYERGIIMLDLTDLSLAIIQLPQGVDYYSEDTMLSQADDAAGLYLVHLKMLKLRAWIHKVDGWLLVHTICLHELCASLSVLDHNGPLQLKHVWNNAQFVFLEMGRWILYLDVQCRALRKVYKMTEDENESQDSDIYPLMMTWPPMFAALKDDPSRYVPLKMECVALINTSSQSISCGHKWHYFS